MVVACWTANQCIPSIDDTQPFPGYTGADVGQIFHPVPIVYVTSLLHLSLCQSGACVSESDVPLPRLFTSQPSDPGFNSTACFKVGCTDHFEYV